MHTCTKAKVKVKARDHLTLLAKAPRILKAKGHLTQPGPLTRQELVLLDNRVATPIKVFLQAGSLSGVPRIVATTM